MDRERNRKYTTSTPRNKRYLSTEPIRSNYLNTPNGELLHKPSADIIENKVPVNNAISQKENHKSSVLKSNHYSDFPLPTKKRPKLPKIKVNLTYKKIMLSLAVLLLITLVANLALFYNYQKNHPAQAKIVLQEDTGKGIEIDDYSAYDKTPVTANFINSYKTEKDLPKLLQIQKINLNSRIKIVSSDSGGSIKVPKNINDVGWYEGSSKPGDRGVVFLDGTSSYDGAQGVFINLDRLSQGDDISIIMGDGSEVKYKVKKTKKIDSKNFNILSSIDPPEIKGQGLSITINYGPPNDHFLQRYIVLAEKQQ